jgi:type III pantothenate kinase
MMLLDVGNTSLRWAFQDIQGLAGQGSFVHRGHEMAGLAGDAWADLESPDGMAVANVAGQSVQDTITRWAEAHWNLQPVFVQAVATAAGVTNGYAIPGQLGVDRWAAMVAAWREQQTAVLVIDCGTAITIDFVDAGGRHHGGLIAPGVDMMRQSLSRETADIDILPADQVQPVTRLADGTEAAIRNGTIRMAAAMIDSVVADISRRYDSSVCAVLAGGDATRIRPLLGCNTIHDPDLVLKGVAILVEEQA